MTFMEQKQKGFISSKDCITNRGTRNISIKLKSLLKESSRIINWNLSSLKNSKRTNFRDFSKIKEIISYRKINWNPVSNSAVAHCLILPQYQIHQKIVKELMKKEEKLKISVIMIKLD